MHQGTRYKLHSSCQTGLLLLQLACFALLLSYEQDQSSTWNSPTSWGSSSSGFGHSEAPGPLARGGTAWLQGEALTASDDGYKSTVSLSAHNWLTAVSGNFRGLTALALSESLDPPGQMGAWESMITYGQRLLRCIRSGQLYCRCCLHQHMRGPAREVPSALVCTTKIPV